MKLIFTLFFLLTNLLLMAQAPVFSGVVLDRQEGTAVPDATVTLMSAVDSSFRYTTRTDSAGRFSVSAVPGSYRLLISNVAFLAIDSLLKVPSETSPAGRFLLAKNNGLLESVTVTAVPPPVRQKNDTLEYSSGAFRVNPDANAQDLVRKMPGITVEQGKVKAGGEDVRKVTVDGRDFFGEDATATLQNLPAEIIDKIQVFDRLSEQAQLTGFEDDNTAKGINIGTKPNMRNGQFGRIYAGYGTDDRYAAGGNVSFFSGNRRISLVGLTNNINLQNFATEDLLGVTSSGGGGRRQGGSGGGAGGGQGSRGGNTQGNFLVGQQSGISKTNAAGINYSDLWGKKLSVTGSYFFNNSNNAAEESVNRQYFINADSSQFYDEKSLSTARNDNHRFNLRMEYKIDPSNTLIITPNFSYQKNESESSVAGLNLLPSKTIISETGNRTTNNNTGYNFNNNILFRHAFQKKGRSFSINLTTGLNDREGDNYLEALNRSYGTGGSNDSIRQYSSRNTNGLQLSSNIAYTEPIGKKGMLQFNYRPSYSENHSDQQTFQYDYSDGKYSLFDDSLSNTFDSRYTTQNAGVNYRLSDKGNSFSVGMAYQHAELESLRQFPVQGSIRRNFSNLLPSLMWNRKLSTKSSVRVSYRTNTTVPTVNQMQEVINNNNPLILRTGNPALDQQMGHNLSARYSYTNTAKGLSLLGNVFVQKTDDYVGNASFIAAEDSVLSQSVTLYRGSQLVKPVNLDGYWNARSFLTFGMPLTFMKSTMNWNAGYQYARIPGIINGAENTSANSTFTAGAVLASNISEKVDFTLSYSGNFSSVRNSLQPGLNNRYFSQVAGVRVNLLSNDGWTLENDLNHQSYHGLTDGFNQRFWLWNAGIGKKFLKDRKGELKLTVFDLLKQNQSISRNVQETYIEDIQTRVLQQYFMLTFTYKLRNFGGK